MSRRFGAVGRCTPLSHDSAQLKWWRREDDVMRQRKDTLVQGDSGLGGGEVKLVVKTLYGENLGRMVKRTLCRRRGFRAVESGR